MKRASDDRVGGGRAGWILQLMVCVGGLPFILRSLLLRIPTKPNPTLNPKLPETQSPKPQTPKPYPSNKKRAEPPTKRMRSPKPPNKGFNVLGARGFVFLWLLSLGSGFRACLKPQKPKALTLRASGGRLADSESGVAC